MIYLPGIARIGKSIETESQLGAAKGWRLGKDGKIENG